MADLVIFGAGEIAELACLYFTRDSEHEVAGFAVDSAYRRADTFQDRPLVDFEVVVDRFPPDKYRMFVALSYAGMNRVRAQKYLKAKEFGYDFVSYVSSRCTYLSDKPCGENCFILEDNTIQPFVTIGNNVTLWSGNHIGHASTIEDHVNITSHVVVSGNCRIGTYSFIGVNATLRNSITIAPHSLIGAGAVITENTEEYGVYVPQRATRLERRSDEVDL